MTQQQLEFRQISGLQPFEHNARTHSPEQIEHLAQSIRQFGFTNPVLITAGGTIVAGHGRVEAARLVGLENVPTLVVGDDWTPEQLRAYVLADNQLALTAGWDEDLLALELGELSDAGFNLELTGFDPAALDRLLDDGDGDDGAPQEAPKTSLAERFGIAPFSVLNAREGWWQDRKRAWLALGIRSEIGRGENALGFSETILEPDAAKRAKKGGATLGAIAPNQKSILKRTGSYAVRSA